MKQDSRETLRTAASFRGEACVTITLNTHRTAPDYLKDPVQLKNMLAQANARLREEFGPKVAGTVMEKLNALASSVDHAHNLESLVLYANPEVSGMVKLPVAVVDRVSVDDRFATRDLMRALQRSTEYYVLWLNRSNTRLIQAFNGSFVQEIKGDFPMNNTVARTDAAKQVLDRKWGPLHKEYFNRVDKALVKSLNENPLPVVLATEKRNVDYYKAIADKPDFIKVDFNPSHDNLKPVHLVAEAWKVLEPVVKARYNDRVKKLESAVSSGNLTSDYNNIWRALNEGRGETLFVKQGLFQPALINDDGQVELLPASERERHGAVDDIIDEMIERNLAHGGDTVFVSGDELDRFNGIALVTRY